MQKMKFNLKLFLLMLIVCAVIAAVAAWLTGLNIWILMGIAVVAVLVNGLIASVEDKNQKE
jgi:membrane protein implicated in regulation of membrane protease activity